MARAPIPAAAADLMNQTPDFSSADFSAAINDMSSYVGAGYNPGMAVGYSDSLPAPNSYRNPVGVGLDTGGDRVTVTGTRDNGSILDQITGVGSAGAGYYTAGHGGYNAGGISQEGPGPAGDRVVVTGANEQTPPPSGAGNPSSGGAGGAGAGAVPYAPPDIVQVTATRPSDPPGAGSPFDNSGSNPDNSGRDVVTVTGQRDMPMDWLSPILPFIPGVGPVLGAVNLVQSLGGTIRNTNPDAAGSNPVPAPGGVSMPGGQGAVQPPTNYFGSEDTLPGPMGPFRKRGAENIHGQALSDIADFRRLAPNRSVDFGTTGTMGQVGVSSEDNPLFGSNSGGSDMFHFAQGGMVGPGGQPMEVPTPAAGIASPQQMAQQRQPQMNAQTMDAEIERMASENPQAMAQINAAIQEALSSGELTPQELNTVVQMAKAVSRNPNMYPQVREFAIKNGLATEQDLPPQYDAGLVMIILAAAKAAQIRIQGGASPAQNQVPVEQQAPVASMAKGGQVPSAGNPGGATPIVAHEGEYVIPKDVVLRLGTDHFKKMIAKAREPDEPSQTRTA